MTQLEFLDKLIIWWERQTEFGQQSNQPFSSLCREYDSLYDDYIFQNLYGGRTVLSPETIELIDRHLEDCTWCQRGVVERENQSTGRLVMAIARGGESPGQDCPNNDDLWDFISKLASTELERRIEEHVVQCPKCAQVVTWFYQARQHCEKRLPVIEERIRQIIDRNHDKNCPSS